MDKKAKMMRLTTIKQIMAFYFCLEDESGSENENENMSDEENSITREFIDWGDEGSMVKDEEETDDE